MLLVNVLALLYKMWFSFSIEMIFLSDMIGVLSTSMHDHIPLSYSFDFFGHRFKHRT
jgi:hypothetical protein